MSKTLNHHHDLMKDMESVPTVLPLGSEFTLVALPDCQSDGSKVIGIKIGDRLVYSSFSHVILHGGVFVRAGFTLPEAILAEPTSLPDGLVYDLCDYERVREKSHRREGDETKLPGYRFIILRDFRDVHVRDVTFHSVLSEISFENQAACRHIVTPKNGDEFRATAVRLRRVVGCLPFSVLKDEFGQHELGFFTPYSSKSYQSTGFNSIPRERLSMNVVNDQRAGPR